MKKRVIIIAIIILSIIATLLTIKILLESEDKSITSKDKNPVTENKEAYIKFGYRPMIGPAVMGYVSDDWYYKITRDKELYYCYNIYSGKTLNESDKEKAADGFREDFIKTLNDDTLDTIEEYIYEINTNSSLSGDYYVSMMEDNEWNHTYIGIKAISYLKELIDE